MTKNASYRFNPPGFGNRRNKKRLVPVTALLQFEAQHLYYLKTAFI